MRRAHGPLCAWQRALEQHTSIVTAMNKIPLLLLTPIPLFRRHGGPEASNWLAKELLPNIISGALCGKPNGDVQQILTESFEQGDKKLMVHLENLGNEVLSNAGSTGTVIVVQHNGKVTGICGYGDLGRLIPLKTELMMINAEYQR